MARGTSLIRLLEMYRSACRLSRNAAHNNQVRDTQVEELQQKQDFFWEDFAWPHLRVERFINVQAGQRYYDPLSATLEDGTGGGDLDITRISRIDVRYSAVYNPVDPGIDDGHYAAHDSETDQRAWPPRRWLLTEDEQIEIWPVPDQNADTTTLEGRVRIIGIRKLRPLVADADVCDIDDQLLVKSAAADYLAATGAKDAQLKLDQAARLYAKIKGQLMPRKKFRMFAEEDRRPAQPVINHYRPPSV